MFAFRGVRVVSRSRTTVQRLVQTFVAITLSVGLGWSTVPAQASTTDDVTSTPTGTATPVAPSTTSDTTTGTSGAQDAAPAPTVSPSPTPAATDTSVTSPDVESAPTQAQMDSAHNHTMGSSLQGQPIASVAPRVRSLAVTAHTYTTGIDVSAWQTFNASNWSAMYGAGVRFAYVKATEGTGYVSSQFQEQYNDSYNSGMFHGAYHFANPNASSGAAQANYFADHGGGWTPDGRTLPPAIDLESEAGNSPPCYGLSQAAMVSWILDFSNTMMQRTGRLPAIYSNPSWWSTCTGNTSALAANPLFIARWVSDPSGGPGSLPGGWNTFALWQWTDAGSVPNYSGSMVSVDMDYFNGSLADMTTFAVSGTGGGYLVRTVTDTSLYLLAGSQKYPISTMDIANQYMALGPVRYVAQSFLDSIPTAGSYASLLVRNTTDGSVSLIQNAALHHFPSCDLVAAYGYQCSQTTDLPAAEYQLFQVAGDMSPYFVTPGSTTVYDLYSGAKYPVLTWSDVLALNGGASPFVPTMTTTAAAALPTGNVVVAPRSLIKTATSDSIYMTDGLTNRYGVSTFDLAADYGAFGYRVVPDSVMSGYTAAGANISIAAQCGGTQYVASQGTLRQWDASSGAAGLPISPLDPLTCALIPRGTSFSGDLFIKSTDNGTVYQVVNGARETIWTWDQLLALTGGATPTIIVLNPGTVARIPMTKYSLRPGTVGRTVSDTSVYVIDGTTRIPVHSLTTTSELGLPNWSYIDATTLGNYSIGSSFVTRVVTCGSNSFFGIGGVLHPLTSPDVTGITATNLSTATCSGLPHASAAAVSQVYALETGNPTIYQISGGQKHPVSGWARLLQLNGGSAPVFFSTVSGGLSDIPLGSTL